VAATAEDITMAEPSVYLEKLSAFSRMLRLQGFTISPEETADAGRILIELGLEDREQAKTALRTVYAKTREEQLRFDQVFDGFFISEEAMRKQAREQMEKEAEMDRARREMQGQDVQLDDNQMDAYASLPREERQKLLDFAEKYRNTARNNPKLYGNFIHSVFAKTLLEQQLRMEDAAVGVEAADPELGLLYRDISAFKDTEIPKAISIIQTVSRQINGELSAKRNRNGYGGKLDFRSTIRKGLETGGSLYRLKYKKKRSRRKNLVLLCDVSGSMMQFSEFALRFIQSLNQVSESSRVFLFSEEVYEADNFSLQNMDKFRSYVKECGVYGKGTDLGAALRKLMQMQPCTLNSATTLIILSDTKTVDQGGAIAALKEAKRQAGRVLWLNPIPEKHWRHIRSVQTFAALCTMVSCATLQSLAAACRKLTQY
jgi:uncharacterized protein with von Willebrand factor type A (vWA) domain